MRVMTVFAGAMAAMLLVLPAASQSSREAEEEAQQKADLAKLMADPALSPQANADFLVNNLKQPGVRATRDGLQYKIIRNGFGRHPGAADTVEVYYTGKFINGKIFDGTSPGLPALLQVGKVVSGWTEALQMMREGDRWLIWLPANLGYGVRGDPAHGMPPGQTLFFDLTLLSANGPPRPGTQECARDPDCAAESQKAQAQQQGQQ